MSPEELRREARDAEQHCRFARAARLRHKADVLEAQAAQSDDELAGLTVAELARVIDEAAARVMAASAELFRREGEPED